MPPLTDRTERRLCRELKDVRRRLAKDAESKEDLDPDDIDGELRHLYHRAIRYENATYKVMKEAAEKPPPPPRDPRRLAARKEPPQPSPRFYMPPEDVRREPRSAAARESRRLRELRELERENRRRVEAREEFDRRHSNDLKTAYDALQKAVRAQDALRDYIKQLERQRRREEAGQRHRGREGRQAGPDQEPPPPYQSVETLPRYQESPEGQTYEERTQREHGPSGAVSELVTAQLQSLNLR